MGKIKPSFKLCSQEAGLKDLFPRHFSFEIEKNRTVELNSFIHVKEYKVCCHLLVSLCICHWEAHSYVLSKWSMKNVHIICLKQNISLAFNHQSKIQLLCFLDHLLPFECVPWQVWCITAGHSKRSKLFLTVTLTIFYDFFFS